MKKIISFFSAAFILFCFCCNVIKVSAYTVGDVDLSDNDFLFDVFDGDYSSNFEPYENYLNDIFNLRGLDPDNFSYFAFVVPGSYIEVMKLPKDLSGYSIDYVNDSIIIKNLLSNNFSDWAYFNNFNVSSSVASGISINRSFFGYFNSDKQTYEYQSDMNSAIFKTNIKLCDTVIKGLNFTFSENFENHMICENYNDTFTLTAENMSDNRYNYIVYITDSPVVSVASSFNNATYILSSSQWSNKFVSSTVTPSDVTDYISRDTIDTLSDGLVNSLFGSLGSVIYDVFGNAFNPYDLYISANTYQVEFYRTSYGRCPFYSISGLNNQPVHHRNPVSKKNHVISFKDLGLEIGKQYYFNIAYLDVSDIETMSYNKELQNLFPLYNTNLLSKYSLYSSTPFSFDTGEFIKNSDDMYSMSDYYNSSNIHNSDGFLNGDNSVSTNVNTSLSPSANASIYYNYGTIYHGCSNFNNSFSGSSSGSGSASSPDLPDADFKDLTDKTGKFFDFIKSIWIASGWLPAALFVTAVTVAIFCRVAGR